ncbi:MAG: dephospho-CoA kinase [Planctomycetota bacterium]|nr:dephospho-CoA kinase [Planctomycetota bacterium]
MILGILGGIGSGKSTVTDMFATLGANTLDADAIAHELIEKEEAKATLRQWWGDEIITAEGKVDRTKIAEKVFSDAAELVRLNNLIHPGVRKRIEEAIGEFTAKNSEEKKLLVLDVPLLASSTLRDFCDEIIFVSSDESLRQSRTRLRGWSKQDLEQREACQVPENDKKELAGFIINNSGSLDETRQQVEALYQDLVAMDFS